MGRPLGSKVAIVCLAVLTCLVGVCSPRVRAFAAARLTSIHPTHGTALTQSGPIPYILDLSNHKGRKPSSAKPPKAAAGKAGKPAKHSPKPSQPGSGQQAPPPAAPAR